MKLKIKPQKQSKPYTCLPRAVKIILEYFGVKKSEEELEKIYRTTESGTSNISYGLKKMDPVDLMNLLKNKIPVIVFLKASDLSKDKKGEHAVVVIGFSKKDMIFIDVGLGKDVNMPFKSFMDAWKEAGMMGLVILPDDLKSVF